MTCIQQLKHYGVLVDSDIRDWIKRENIRISLNSAGYAKFYCRKTKKTKVLSREILSAGPTHYVDHINRNPRDNRRKNLQLVTPRFNNLRSLSGKRNRSGVKGISWDKYKNRWVAAVYLEQNQRVRKCFKDMDSAIKWRENLVTTIFISNKIVK